MLPERCRRFVEIGNAGHGAQPHGPVRADDQFHGPLDASAAVRCKVEIAAEEQRFEKGADLESLVLEQGSELPNVLVFEVFVDKMAIELGSDEIGRLIFRENQVDQFHTIERSAVPQEDLFSRIVLVRIDGELEAGNVPSREGACCLLHIPLPVVADAEREELHDLAREVLVGPFTRVHAGIQKHEHGRVLSHGDQQFAEVPAALLTERVQLKEHLSVIADLVFVGCEVSMPEQGETLAQRVFAGQHALGPPIADAVGLEPRCAEPVEELVDDRLQRAVPARLDLHAKSMTLGASQSSCRRAAGRKRVERGFEDAGVLEGRLRTGAPDHELANDIVRWLRGECQRFLRAHAEAGTAHEVRGARSVPVCLSDRSQVESGECFGHRAQTEQYRQKPLAHGASSTWRPAFEHSVWSSFI